MTNKEECFSQMECARLHSDACPNGCYLALEARTRGAGLRLQYRSKRYRVLFPSGIAATYWGTVAEMNEYLDTLREDEPQ